MGIGGLGCEHLEGRFCFLHVGRDLSLRDWKSPQGPGAGRRASRVAHGGGCRAASHRLCVFSSLRHSSGPCKTLAREAGESVWVVATQLPAL